jgi:hypothetical protein
LSTELPTDLSYHSFQSPLGTPESGSPPTEESTSIMNLATSLLASGAVPPDTDIHRKYLYEELLGKVR